MTTKRLLFFVMAICLASGMRAQFNDKADDIYYYVNETNSKSGYQWAEVLIFNFDGQKACVIEETISNVKKNLSYNSSYYVNKFKSERYSLHYIPSEFRSASSYQGKKSWSHRGQLGLVNIEGTFTYEFISEREKLIANLEEYGVFADPNVSPVTMNFNCKYKKVNKYYF